MSLWLTRSAIKVIINLACRSVQNPTISWISHLDCLTISIANNVILTDFIFVSFLSMRKQREKWENNTNDRNAQVIQLRGLADKRSHFCVANRTTNSVHQVLSTPYSSRSNRVNDTGRTCGFSPFFSLSLH